jgi:two-component system chemotaxis response regulator CheY
MSLNILVVDDSAVMRSIVIKALRMSGLSLGELYQAANGQEGLDMLDEHWVDLVLLDINMPVMSGDEMIERLRKSAEQHNLPIIVVSTESSETRIQALSDDGIGFVHKPFNPQTLREQVIALTGIQTGATA